MTRRCTSKGLKSATEVARDVGQARPIEKREGLVVFPPQLAEPLDGQRLWRDDEATLDLSGVHEAIQDQRRLNRLSEADFVGEEPPNRIGRARALRDVELVREEANAPAKEDAEAVGFAQGQQMKDVEARPEVLDLVEVAAGPGAREGRLRDPAATACGGMPCARSRAAAIRPVAAP